MSLSPPALGQKPTHFSEAPCSGLQSRGHNPHRDRAPRQRPVSFPMANYLLLPLTHGQELEAAPSKTTPLSQFHEVAGWVRARTQDKHDGRVRGALLENAVKADHRGLHVPGGETAVCVLTGCGARAVLPQTSSHRQQDTPAPSSAPTGPPGRGGPAQGPEAALGATGGGLGFALSLSHCCFSLGTLCAPGGSVPGA